jgi:hypothetical protein
MTFLRKVQKTLIEELSCSITKNPKNPKFHAITVLQMKPKTVRWIDN